VSASFFRVRYSVWFALSGHDSALRAAVYDTSTWVTVYVFQTANARFRGAYTFAVSALRLNKEHRCWVPLVKRDDKKIYRQCGELLV
jgi:hypothetical protein